MTTGVDPTGASRPNPRPLLAVSAALKRMLDFFRALEAEELPLGESAGRILAEPVMAAIDLPLFANSSMDGFAVRSGDVEEANTNNGVKLPVVADIPAGQSLPIFIQPGQAARIMTGAPLPEGADAVVPVEETDFQRRLSGEAAPENVVIYKPAKAGANVRPRGQDLRAGEAVLDAGVRLRPQDIGILAMLGHARVRVHRQPVISVFSSGDELVPVHLPLSPGKIHDSNTYTLVSLIERCGGQPFNLGIIPDQYEAVHQALESAAEKKVDLILSSAGVSVGAFDFVRSVVEEHGHLDFWRVNMRPGKPLAFGDYRGIPFVGLPGNPVSAFVGFEVFVRPALMKMLGLQNWSRPVQQAELLEPIESDGRESYLRARVQYSEGSLTATLTGHQGSGNLRSLVQANALILIPSGVKSLPAGSRVETWSLNEL